MGDNPLDNYSPFDDVQDPETKPKPAPVPAPSTSNTQEDEDDIAIREYEKRLNILESRINAQVTQLAVAQETGFVGNPPNWPAFYPLVHFDIEEVPPGLRSFVNEAMFGWCLMCIAFALNWLSCVCLLNAGDSVGSPGTKIILSTLYLFVVVPLSLDLTGLAVYRVMKIEPSTFAFLKVLICLSAATLFEFILAIGLDSSGSVGLITMLNLFFNGHWFIGILGILTTAALGLTCANHGRLVLGIWKYYRGTEVGANMENDIKKSLAVKVVEALNKSRSNDNNNNNNNNNNQH
ncbi:hypothetical protein TVAG_292630 [Trichomonas vaginalis G3]|uniref:Secretory carrier membrane protein n=1 Tax=Trichomonas vaginalis (strain ATCC PRA-98 / G3) TaxID=412133 RepID=A2F0D5_TRIV3|nr:protein transport [Trichomonas vaginalis G3]EAY01630.1 hypothetical protein TVAG_292630 [Trichomonas vaginalis G3]KAI5551595.1 protein transport [Trichomonas vaginalis G3]|eukprot:XP_001330362.1 hypothetical protein [Trichomonas vaginalis G3]